MSFEIVLQEQKTAFSTKEVEIKPMMRKIGIDLATGKEIWQMYAYQVVICDTRDNEEILLKLTLPQKEHVFQYVNMSIEFEGKMGLPQVDVRPTSRVVNPGKGQGKCNTFYSRRSIADTLAQPEYQRGRIEKYNPTDFQKRLQQMCGKEFSEYVLGLFFNKFMAYHASIAKKLEREAKKRAKAS